MRVYTLLLFLGVIGAGKMMQRDHKALWIKDDTDDNDEESEFIDDGFDQSIFEGIDQQRVHEMRWCHRRRGCVISSAIVALWASLAVTWSVFFAMHTDRTATMTTGIIAVVLGAIPLVILCSNACFDGTCALSGMADSYARTLLSVIVAVFSMMEILFIMFLIADVHMHALLASAGLLAGFDVIILLALCCILING